MREKCPLCNKATSIYLGESINAAYKDGKLLYYQHDACRRKWKKVLVTEAVCGV